MDSKDVDILCEICFHPYSNERMNTRLLPCNHQICFVCVTICVPKKEICPFCKQNVVEVLQGDNVRLTMNELILQFTQDEEPVELSQLFMLDHSFFNDDVSILVSRLKECYQRLRQTINQKDLQFDTKWQIYEKIEIQVTTISKIVKERLTMDPLDIIQKISMLIQVIEDLKFSRWNSKNLDQYYEVYSQTVDNGSIDQQFFISQKKKSRKRSHQQSQK